MKQKILKVAAAALALSMVAGCIVLSVYPFYTPKDLTFDPALAGSWAKDGTTNEIWEFTAAGEKSYMLFTVDTDTTNGFYAHLFKLKQFLFLDLLTTNHNDEFKMPLHLISKVSRSDTNMSLNFMDFGWLSGFLETNPAALRHIIVPEKPDDTNSDKMVYLTASTRDLQIFLLKYAANTNAFSASSAVELHRYSP